ncbi:MAG TPA: molybdate ABC transporter substrate-binding protein [Acidobacteriaceae bacterium]|nr:molybdate ABC transporter substrate-binding protein [Acidobacteriaceae bacterium]
MFNPLRRMFLVRAILLPAMLLHAQTKTLRIAAAADLQPVLPSLIHNFEKSSGAKVEVSYASSATLATQILNGAPYDIFLAANLAFPQKIVAANLAEESAPIIYAHGSLVLWAHHGLFHHGLTMQSLTSPTVHRIAVANPVHAPYGAAAMAAIQSLGLKSALQPKLVFAENIAQAAQFGQSGNADCALISKTLAITKTMHQAGRFVAVPVGAYPPILQGGVVLRNAADKQTALDFLHYLQSPAGRNLLATGGLVPPAQ